MKRLCAVLCFIAVLPTTRVAADPLPSATIEASKIDIMGLRLGMSPAEVKPLMEALQPGIQVNVQENMWPDGIKYVSAVNGVWRMPNKNSPSFVTRGETINVYFSAPVSGNKAFWIKRAATFFDGQEVSKEATTQALVTKYGKPADIGRVGIDFKWTYGNLNVYADAKEFFGVVGQLRQRAIQQ